MATELNKPESKTPKGACKRWNILVRHSPFLLKQADVDADSPDEAKEKFLALVVERTEKIAAGEMGQAALHNGGRTNPKEKKRIMETYQLGLAAVKSGETKFVIRPTADVEAERAALKDARSSAEAKLDKLLAAMTLAKTA